MESLAELVTTWFDRAARDLPWRHPEVTPWGVLISEVMLQQTPVARVEPVWREWLARWPTPADLAATPPAEAIRAWGRLGYPRRALRLHQCAVTVVERHDGAVPERLTELLALPGIGGYTGRAVAAFAFGQRHPVVDTNVRRFVARAVAGRPDGGAATTPADLAATEALLPARPDRAARASAAFMELGALLCTARAPRCGQCPVRLVCSWYQAGQPAGTAPARRAQGYAGTDRQVRGLLLAVLRGAPGPVPAPELDQVWHEPVQRGRALDSLVADGLVTRLGPNLYALPGAVPAAPGLLPVRPGSAIPEPLP